MAKRSASSDPSSSSWSQALNRLAEAHHPPVVADGDYQIPWSDPLFSERMLQVHLDENTHMASRQPQVIQKHVAWLAAQLAERYPDPGNCHIVDVGCGPGLYLHELAAKGFQTIGFDFAPAPLKWAEAEARRRNLNTKYLNLDLTHLPDDFCQLLGPVDAITFWFGEFHSFSRERVQQFLPRLASCLKPGGHFFLEYQPLDWFVQEESNQWSHQESSVLCDRPHLWLEEFGWDAAQQTEVHVHWILEQDSGKLKRYVQYHHGWTDEELTAILAEAGLVDPVFHPPITGASDEFEFAMLVTQKADH